MRCIIQGGRSEADLGRRLEDVATALGDFGAPGERIAAALARADAVIVPAMSTVTS